MSLSTSLVLLCGILGAVILTYLPFLVVGWARFQVGYNMSAPRAMFDKFPPYAQRATWAHQNSFESLTIFSAAALSAYVTGVDSTVAVAAVAAYLGARLLYSIFYIADVPLARSLMFAIGSICIFVLFGLSIAVEIS